MDHAVDIAIEPEKQSELCFVLDFAFDGGARRVFLDKHLPWIAHGLLQTEGDPAFYGVDLEDLYFDFLRS